MRTICFVLKMFIPDDVFPKPLNARQFMDASTPGKPLWPKLSAFFAANETISLVETKEPPDKSFRAFVTDLSVKRSSGIHELKFSDAEYDAEFMVQLAILFESREITVLSITNRATESGAATLASLLPSCTGFQNLRELTLVGCPLIEARAFIGPLPKLRTFTAEDPGLDIGLFLAQFCACQSSELEELTLLAGRVASPLPLEGSFPSRLTKLSIPDARWDGGNMCRFFAIIARRTGDRLLTLNVARAKQAADQWAAFDHFLRDYKFDGIEALVFDGNNIGNGFRELLDQSTNLQTLSLNACAVESPITHGLIAQAIAVSKTLHNLLLQGTSAQNYKAVMEKYIDAVLENSSLKYFDISGNRIGNDVLDMLKGIFQKHPKIREVLFDLNGVTDLDKLYAVYGVAGSVGRRIFLRFPNQDIEKLKNAGKIKDAEIHRMRNRCAEALRKSVRGRGKEGNDDNEEPQKSSRVLKPGEFLDLLVTIGGTTTQQEAEEIPPEIRDIVEKQNGEFIGDAQWIRATADAVGTPEELPEIAAFQEAATFEALLAQIA
jgi:hypothetical protein